MSYPTGLPSYTDPTANETLAAGSHTALHIQNDADIIALATKVGTGASTPVNQRLLRGNGAGTSAWAQADLITDVTGVLPQANGGTGGNAAILAVIYPVGCIYTEITGTNPGTTFGFGTWSQTGKGRVLVGQGTSDQLFAAAAIGGESSHTLSGAESGTSAHGHNITDPTHVHAFSTVYNNSDTPTTGAANGMRLNATSNQNFSISSAATGVTVDNSTAANASNSHNNLQPYQVVYFWTRTA